MGTSSKLVGHENYVEVGVGPLYIEVMNHERGRLHFGGQLPPSDTDAWVTLSQGLPFSYQGTETAYLRSEPNLEKMRVTIVEVR